MGAGCSRRATIEAEQQPPGRSLASCLCCAACDSPDPDSDDSSSLGALELGVPLQPDTAASRGGGHKRRGSNDAPPSPSSSASGSAPPSVFDALYGRYVPFVVRQRFIAAIAANASSAAAAAASASAASAAAAPSIVVPLPSPRRSSVTTPSMPLSVHPRVELEVFDGAVCFVDISGFTRLSEQLVSQHGSAGAELLNDLISAYFTRLIDTIVEFGGDVSKFAGDAMLVVWRNKQQQPVITLDDANSRGNNATGDNNAASSQGSGAPPFSFPSNPSSPRSSASSPRKDLSALLGAHSYDGSGGGGDQPLATLLLRATAACLTLLKLHNFFQPTPSNTLTLHMGLAAGPLVGVYTGGHEGCFEYFCAGQPIHHMALACDAARSGELVLHAHSYELIKNYVRAKRCRPKAPSAPAASSSSSSANSSAPIPAFVVTHLLDAPSLFKCAPPRLPPVPALERALECFVPRLVQRRVENEWMVGSGGVNAALSMASQSALWLAEFRTRVAVMFVALPSLRFHSSLASNAPTLSLLQAMVLAVQECVSRLEGTVARLLSDDKGTRFKIAFGMPGAAHEDDASRVVHAAMDIESRIRRIVATHPAAAQALQRESDESSGGSVVSDVSIGVAHGNVYCGEAGSGVRCEYTAVGFTVILAARLMSAAAAQGGGILLDRETVAAASRLPGASSSSLRFEALPPVTLKGVSRPVEVFRPRSRAGATLSAKSAKMLGLERDSTQASVGGTDTAARVGRVHAMRAVHQQLKVTHSKRSPTIRPANPTGEPDPAARQHPSSSGHMRQNSAAFPRSIMHVRTQSLLPFGSPLSLAAAANRAGPASPTSSAPDSSAFALVGRSAEKSLILSLLHRCARSDETHVMLLEGEAGLGKTALVLDVLRSIPSLGLRGVQVYAGAGEQREKRTPYFAWRSIFEQLLPGLDGCAHPSQRRRAIEACLGDELLAWGALLNPLLNVDFAETVCTRNLSAESRARNLQRLLVAILGEMAREAPEDGEDADGEGNGQGEGEASGDGSTLPASSWDRFASIGRMRSRGASASLSALRSSAHSIDGVGGLVDIDFDRSNHDPVRLAPRVIVLEELQSLDSGSWELLVDVARMLPSILLLLTTRPLESPVMHLTSLARMRGDVTDGSGAGAVESIEACFHHLKLRELERAHVLTLAWMRLGGSVSAEELEPRAAPPPMLDEEKKLDSESRVRSTSAASVGTGVKLAVLGSASAAPPVPALSLPSAPVCLPRSVQLPPALQQLLFDASRGNPLYVEELVRALVEEGVVTVTHATDTQPFRVEYKPSETNSSSSSPAATHGSFVSHGSALLPAHALLAARNVLQLMTSRIDRLPPSQQLALKICSILGLEIRAELVARIHPMQSSALRSHAGALDPAALAQATKLVRKDLDALVEAGILLADEVAAPATAATEANSNGSDDDALNTERVYSFRTPLFREAAATMLSMQQRVSLHEQCAMYYEQTFGAQREDASSSADGQVESTHSDSLSDLAPSGSAPDPLEPYYSLLQHHYLRAERWDRALHYTLRSGSLALRVNANHEALKTFELALELIRRPGAGAGLSLQAQERRLRLVHSELAAALYALGRYTRAIVHLEASLALLDVRVHAGVKPGAERASVVASSLAAAGAAASSGSFSLPAASSSAQSVESLHAAAMVADERDAREIPLRKLYKSLIKSWSSAPSGNNNERLTPAERERLVSSVHLLTLLCRSAVLSGLAWRSAYAAYLCLLFSRRLRDSTLEALSVAQAAVVLHELGPEWTKLATPFKARMREIVARVEEGADEQSSSPSNAAVSSPSSSSGAQQATESLRLSPLDHARLLLHASTLSVFDGNWTRALDSLVVCRSALSRLSAHKLQREAMHLHACVFCAMSRWHESYTAFAALNSSATADGDDYYAAQAKFWMRMLERMVEGDDTASAAGEEQEAGDETDSANAAINARNFPMRLLQLQSSYWRDGDASPLLLALPSILALLGSGQIGLLSRWPLLLLLTDLLAEVLDAAQEANRVAEAERHAKHKPGTGSAPSSPRSSLSSATTLAPAQVKKLQGWLEKSLALFDSLSESFPPARAWSMVAHGRLLWLQGRASQASKCWRRAADRARREGQGLVVARAWYLLGTRGAQGDGGSNGGGSGNRGLLLRCVALLRKLGVSFHAQRCFALLHPLADVGAAHSLLDSHTNLLSATTANERPPVLARTPSATKQNVTASATSATATSNGVQHANCTSDAQAESTAVQLSSVSPLASAGPPVPLARRGSLPLRRSSIVRMGGLQLDGGLMDLHSLNLASSDSSAPSGMLRQSSDPASASPAAPPLPNPKFLRRASMIPRVGGAASSALLSPNSRSALSHRASDTASLAAFQRQVLGLTSPPSSARSTLGPTTRRRASSALHGSALALRAATVREEDRETDSGDESEAEAEEAEKNGDAHGELLELASLAPTPPPSSPPNAGGSDASSASSALSPSASASASPSPLQPSASNASSPTSVRSAQQLHSPSAAIEAQLSPRNAASQQEQQQQQALEDKTVNDSASDSDSACSIDSDGDDDDRSVEAQVPLPRFVRRVGASRGESLAPTAMAAATATATASASSDSQPAARSASPHLPEQEAAVQSAPDSDPTCAVDSRRLLDAFAGNMHTAAPLASSLLSLSNPNRNADACSIESAAGPSADAPARFVLRVSDDSDSAAAAASPAEGSDDARMPALDTDAQPSLEEDQVDIIVRWHPDPIA